MPQYLFYLDYLPISAADSLEGAMAQAEKHLASTLPLMIERVKTSEPSRVWIYDRFAGGWREKEEH